MDGLRQLVHPAGRDAADPGLLDHRDEGFLRGLARLQEAREVAALPELRHLEVQHAQTGIERALSIPVAPGRALIGPLVPAGADQALDIGLHDQLQNRLGDGAKKVTLVVLCEQLGKVHVGLGHPLAGRALRSNVPRGGVSGWFVVEVAKLHLDHTPPLSADLALPNRLPANGWPPGITPAAPVKLHHVRGHYFSWGCVDGSKWIVRFQPKSWVICIQRKTVRSNAHHAFQVPGPNRPRSPNWISNTYRARPA